MVDIYVKLAHLTGTDAEDLHDCFVFSTASTAVQSLWVYPSLIGLGYRRDLRDKMPSYGCPVTNLAF